MYKIILAKRAIRNLDKLNENVKARIKEKIKGLVNDPISSSRKLSNRLSGHTGSELVIIELFSILIMIKL